jgi:hypothetical protein
VLTEVSSWKLSLRTGFISPGNGNGTGFYVAFVHITEFLHFSLRERERERAGARDVREEEKGEEMEKPGIRPSIVPFSNQAGKKVF